jgi:hypothetical protein
VKKDGDALKTPEMKRHSKSTNATANSTSQSLVPTQGRMSQGAMLMELFDPPDHPKAILVHQIQNLKNVFQFVELLIL